MTEDNRKYFENRISIRIRFLRITIGALLVLAFAMGITSVFLVNRLAKADSEHVMTQICEAETLRFDNKLNLVKHSANMIFEYVDEICETSGAGVYSNESLERIRDFAISVSNQTDGAMAVYFRYNPEITGSGTDGFFWSRKSSEEQFVAEPPTDILAYNSSDIEHVGWFYVPKESGKPLWMTPYYNQNLDVFMISYIIPVYLKSGEFVGVVGVDIDFNTIMDLAGNVQLYDTGKLALVDLSDRLIYYANEDGTAKDERLSNQLYNHVTTINKNSELLQITDERGVDSMICCERLSNGMILYVNVPVSEINANRNRLIVVLVGIIFVILGATLFVVWKNTERIIQPIKKLAEVTSKYAMGDWKESYISESGDEIQELSESISMMANNTQDVLNELNEIARADALTGVKNKTCYLELVEAIKRNRNHRFDAYGVVVMDLNLLKKANDNYGHEAGDALILEASRYIRRVFINSEVFRIGGDEFVVFLHAEEYEKGEELCRQFEAGMFYEVPTAMNIPLAVSYGLATNQEEENMEYDAVFKLADERMYEKKKEMKLGRQD